MSYEEDCKVFREYLYKKRIPHGMLNDYEDAPEIKRGVSILIPWAWCTITFDDRTDSEHAILGLLMSPWSKSDPSCYYVQTEELKPIIESCYLRYKVLYPEEFKKMYGGGIYDV